MEVIDYSPKGPGYALAELGNFLGIRLVGMLRVLVTIGIKTEEPVFLLLVGRDVAE